MTALPKEKTDLSELPSAESSSKDPVGFQRAVESHRQELLLHCYRFVGSIHDAEDLVQETFLRAWRGLGRFQGRASVRSWLYRIATNVCLDALSRRAIARRVFPDDLAGPTSRMPAGPPSTEIPWIEPYPDSALDGAVDASPGPAARYEQREAVRLAFIAATQRLPARQRAVLLLRDVLGWSASETAQALKMTVASANSALQRARSTLEAGLSREEISDAAGQDEAQSSIAARYASAWERTDLDGLVDLLANDATMIMPPWSLWYSGRASIRSLFDWAWKVLSEGGSYKMVATRANSQVAFGTYLRRPGETQYHAHVFQVLTFRKGRIGRLSLFVGPDHFPRFRLAPTLDASW
jgi:RNA polymerase sigma-70 factor (ECF subfamily)